MRAVAIVAALALLAAVAATGVAGFSADFFGVAAQAGARRGPRDVLAARRAVRTGHLPRTPQLHAGAAPPPPVLATLVHQSLVTKITNLIVPLVEIGAMAITIPAVTSKDFNTTAFKLSKFSLGDVTVDFAGTSDIVATFPAIALGIPAVDITVDAIFTKCTAVFSSNVANTRLSFKNTLGWSTTNGSMVLEDVNVTATFGTFDLNVVPAAGSSSFCNDTLAALKLPALIKKIVEADLPKGLKAVIMNVSRELFAHQPLQLTAPPTVTENGLELVMSLIPGNSTPPFSPLVNFAPFPARDVEAYITEGSINTLLAGLAMEGGFSGALPLPPTLNTTALKAEIPGAYALCANCNITVKFWPAGPYPWVTLTSEAVTVGASQIALQFLGSNATVQETELFQASADVSAGIDDIAIRGKNQSTIYFQLDMKTLSATVTQSNVGDVPIGMLVSVLKVAIQDLFIKDFNTKFQGITIPLLYGFGASQLVFNVTQGQLALGANVDIPQL